MFQDKLTTETMLTDDPIKLATLMGTGDASFYVLHHYFLRIIRGVVLKGATFADLRGEVAALAIILGALVAISTLRFSKKLG